MARPLIRTAAIAASANVPDQLTADTIGIPQRTAAYDGPFSLAATQSATGLLIGLTTDLRILAPTILQPVIKATAPIVPDEVIFEDVIGEGELIQLPVVNSTGGVLTLNYALRIP